LQNPTGMLIWKEQMIIEGEQFVAQKLVDVRNGHGNVPLL
jgi:hypothetical protein